MTRKRDPRPDCPNCKKHSMVIAKVEPGEWRCSLCGEHFEAQEGHRVRLDLQPRKKPKGSGQFAGKPYYRGLVFPGGWRSSRADA